MHDNMVPPLTPSHPSHSRDFAKHWSPTVTATMYIRWCRSHALDEAIQKLSRTTQMKEFQIFYEGFQLWFGQSGINKCMFAESLACTVDDPNDTDTQPNLSCDKRCLTTQPICIPLTETHNQSETSSTHNGLKT